jgi:hypothetical protein
MLASAARRRRLRTRHTALLTPSGAPSSPSLGSSSAPSRPPAEVAAVAAAASHSERCLSLFSATLAARASTSGGTGRPSALQASGL